MTTEIREKRFEISTRIGTKTIDMIALIASFAWVGAMVCLSLREGESSILRWLIRGMWGAIFIYASVFMALHTVTTTTVISEDKTLPAGKKAPKIMSPVEQTTVDLQTADSGELAKVVTQNVSEQL